jgi:repressor LexA
MALVMERLKALREQYGFSQRELARICGLGELSIFRYETGATDPSTDALKILAQKLNVSVDYLLGLTNEPRAVFGSASITEEEQTLLQTYRGEGWVGVIKLVGERLSK